MNFYQNNYDLETSKKCKHGPACYRFSKGLCDYYHPYFHYCIQSLPKIKVGKNGEKWVNVYEDFRNETKEYSFAVQFKHFEVTKKTNIEKYSDCRICLKEYELKDYVALTQCNHNFHSWCIAEWMDKNNYCPLCKKPLSAYRNYQQFQFFGKKELNRSEIPEKKS